MTHKLRSVNTKFWDDPFVQSLTPQEKLLFLYILTNPLANILGIYEISIKRIVFDTDLDEGTIRKGFEVFTKGFKVFYEDNFVIVPNWLKNQRLNPNMVTSAINVFLALPKALQDKVLGNPSEWFPNGSKGFETLTECFEKKEEGKRKKEKGKRKKEEAPSERLNFPPPSFLDLKNFGLNHGYKLPVENIFSSYKEKNGNWVDTKGNPIRDWKEKIRKYWFKDEYKLPASQDLSNLEGYMNLKELVLQGKMSIEVANEERRRLIKQGYKRHEG